MVEEEGYSKRVSVLHNSFSHDTRITPELDRRTLMQKFLLISLGEVVPVNMESRQTTEVLHLLATDPVAVHTTLDSANNYCCAHLTLSSPQKKSLFHDSCCISHGNHHFNK